MVRSPFARLARLLVAAAVAAPVAAVVLAASPGPAAAAVPDQWGFAYMNVPAPPPGGAILDPTRSWGSWKILFPADPVRVFPGGGPGRYRVLFPHTASTRGFAHVTAVAGDARWCQIELITPSGTDQIVAVQCYRNGGVPDNTTFTVVYSTSSGGAAFLGGAHAYVKGNPGGGIAYGFNSTGAALASVRLAAGVYRVTLAGVGTGVLDGNLQVTAEQPNLPPRRCKVANWAASGPTTYDVLVYCHNQANVLTDSWFYLSYHRKRAVWGGLAPPDNIAYLWLPGLGGPTDYNSAGCVNSVIASGPVGQYLVVFRCVAIRESHVQVTAFGPSPDYCGLQSVWSYQGPDVLVRNVICWNGAGALANNRFFVTYASRI